MTVLSGRGGRRRRVCASIWRRAGEESQFEGDDGGEACLISTRVACEALKGGIQQSK